MLKNSTPMTQGKQLDYLFETARAGAVAHLIVALMTWAVLSARFPEGERLAVDLVAGLMVLASVAMVVLVNRYRRRKSDDNQVLQRFADAHALVVLFGALTWGLAAFLTIDKSIEIVAYYTLAWAGVSMGAISSQHSSLRSSLISVWGSNPFVAVVYIINVPSYEGYAIAVMIVTFGILLSLLAKRNNQFVRENLQLNESLSERLLEVEELSHRLAYAQQKAEMSERAKSRLMAQASHDFRQPVHAIGIMAECLRDTLDQPEDLEIVKRIELSVEALSGMFRSFLDFHTLDAGHMQAQIQAVSLHDLLSELQGEADELTRHSDVAVRVSVSRSWVRADVAMLGAMVRNLMSNAIKYGRGSVLVGCRHRHGGLAIEVHDNGLGLNDEQQNEIFEEFVRVLDRERPTRDSIGLGLSITQRMAELMGLQIRVRSRMGRGSCFSIEGLSLTDAVVHEPSEDWRDQPCVEQGRQLYLVEDDDAAREGLEALLRRWGYTVFASADCPELAHISTDAVLIIDQSLNDALPGLEWAKQWREQGGQQCVLMSGLEDEPLRKVCGKAGIHLLIKPVAPAQLRSLLLAFDREWRDDQHAS